MAEKLKELGDLKLKSRADAEAVCWGLQQLSKDTKNLGEKTHPLVRLFQGIEGGGCDAAEHLRERGIPELLRVYEELPPDSTEGGINTRLLILKILALYGTTDGALKIIEAAREPLRPDDYMWSVIFSFFKPGHPEKGLLYRSLREPLPPGFIAVSLLDAANTCLLEGEQMLHPFDSAEGAGRLEAWLRHTDEDEYSYAHSATVALPFLKSPARERLLELAMAHPEMKIRIEATWAAAKIGRQDGLHRLAEYCRNFKYAAEARQYLHELGRDDLIPAECEQPEFKALAGFAQWLAHPNELGRVPDELEIVDHRILAWPPERERKPFWLVKYVAKDETGLGEDAVECGLVGSITFCFFGYKLTERPPEDGYGVHCYWEMENAKLIEESDVREDPSEYHTLLKEWRGRPVEDARIQFVAEVSPELGYPQRLVGLASARLEGNDGWLVLDGERSEWYPKSEMPPDVWESIPLKIHIGRHLLGFRDKPDRRKYLATPKPPKAPESVIAGYRKLLADALRRDCKAQTHAFGISSPVTEYFDEFAKALTALGRQSELIWTLHTLTPHWDHATGYGTLGKAAFDCGDDALAESCFLKLRDKYKDSHRSEEMGLLAEIWCRRGKREEAKNLLVHCLRKLMEESRTATGLDKQLFEKWFQNHRATVSKLFPADAEAILSASKLPNSTLG